MADHDKATEDLLREIFTAPEALLGCAGPPAPEALISVVAPEFPTCTACGGTKTHAKDCGDCTA